MPIIQVKGIGPVRIAGDTPTPEEIAGMRRALQGMGSAPEAPQQQKQPQQPMTWGQAAGDAIGNIPSSAANTAQTMAQPFIHPVDTAQALYGLGKGVLELAVPGEQADEGKARAVGQFLAERYGGIENVKRTLASDPVGMMADVSALLSGGGSLAARAPGMVGRAGQVAANVGRMADPALLASKGIAMGARGVGKVGASALGLATGAGYAPVKQAYAAGQQGSREFLDAMRGKTNMADIVQSAKEAIGTMKQRRGAEYAQDIATTAESTQPLDMGDILQTMGKHIDDVTYQGQLKIGPESANKIKEAVQTVMEWEALPDAYKTPMGLDALKQRLGNIHISPEDTQAERFRSGIYNAVKETIVKQSPEYATTMRKYEDASKSIGDIERELSLKGRAPTGTAIRKMQSVMRDNVNTGYGNRAQMVSELEQQGGANLVNALAGSAMSSPTPRGLQALLAGGAGISAVSNPGTLAALPLMSPRLVGEATYTGGRADALLRALLDNVGVNPQRAQLTGRAAYLAGLLGNKKNEGF